MEKRGLLTNLLAIAGSVLVWLTLIAPLVFGLMRLIQSGRFLVDYLMPAEVFPVALVGSLLLLVAAVRARSYQRLIIGSLVLAVVCLVGSQVLAVVTGLASGEIEPTGWQWALVVAGLALYIAGLIGIGVGGILLLRHLFAPDKQRALPA